MPSTANPSIWKLFVPYVLVASFQYQFAKDGLNYASPFVLMSFRYVVVGAIFYFGGGRKMSFEKDALLVALFATVSTALWAVGLQYVSPGDSAVLSYTMPLFSIPVAYLTIREKSSLREIFGAIIGFSGVVLYSLTLNHGSLLFGAILTVINAFFWATYSSYYRKLRNKDPIPVLTTQFILGSIPLLVGAVFLPKFIPTENLFFDLVYIIIFTGVIQYYLWNALLRRGRVGKITTLAFAVPATSIFIDSVRTSTIPSYLSLVGAAVMFLGIFISNWREDRNRIQREKDVPSSVKN